METLTTSHYTTVHYILYIMGMSFCLLLYIPLNKQVHVQWLHQSSNHKCVKRYMYVCTFLSKLEFKMNVSPHTYIALCS